MRRLLFIFSLLSLLGGRAHAQHLYASVRQNGAELESLGTEDFSVGADSPAMVEFIDGKAVMTIGAHPVASLPMSDGGELVLAFETTLCRRCDQPRRQVAFRAPSLRHSLFTLPARRSLGMRGLCAHDRR